MDPERPGSALEYGNDHGARPPDFGSTGPIGDESLCITSLTIDAFRCLLRYPLERNHVRAMAERKRKSTRLTVSLDEADYAALNAMASKSDVSLSWVIRQAIQRFVREHGTEPELPLTLVKQAGRKEASD